MLAPDEAVSNLLDDEAVTDKELVAVKNWPRVVESVMLPDIAVMDAVKVAMRAGSDTPVDTTPEIRLSAPVTCAGSPDS